MPSPDTITALATPPGRSPRAVIRLSGAETFSILRASTSAAAPESPGLHHARFHFPRVPIALITAHAPRSYTGEHTAELHVPGNPCLIDQVIDALVAAGARRAGPGEFSARAFLAGKLTLDQAEGIAALISAERDDDLAAARDLLRGVTGAAYRRWADALTTLLALVEAGVDFTDQDDVVPIAPAALHAQISNLRSEINHHLGPSHPTEHRDTHPVVILVGPPNAGKSTLFNALLRRPRSVVSDQPGTTRDAIEERLDLAPDASHAGAVTLIDLAGLGDAAVDPLDARAQQLARARLESADLLIHCDPAGRFDLLLPPRPTLRVRTKADRPGPSVLDTLPLCALDGWGLAALRRSIAEAASSAGSVARTIPRHHAALRATLAALTAAETTIGPDLRSLAAPELVAGHLREALDHLGEIVGRVTPDDVIGRVFATFCVGK